ncbi:MULTISPECIES: SAM domain-containing protein, partial [Mesorhizobium]|uniref:SAM domain-containing protein n=1 Tax=Mesorhizobium TaxID=68287 RepID=UPI0010A96B68
MDVAAWLRGLGLQRYEQAFRDNAIDAEVLPELTDADLEKLGMLLGHRKRFRKAVVGLEPSSNHPDASTDDIATQSRTREL